MYQWSKGSVYGTIHYAVMYYFLVLNSVFWIPFHLFVSYLYVWDSFLIVTIQFCYIIWSSLFQFFKMSTWFRITVHISYTYTPVLMISSIYVRFADIIPKWHISTVLYYLCMYVFHWVAAYLVIWVEHQLIKQLITLEHRQVFFNVHLLNYIHVFSKI